MDKMNVLTLNGQSFAIEDAAATERLDSLEAGYRHIGTLTNDTGEGISAMELTQDSQGNPFSCSEFLIFATFPMLESGKSTQLYIGPPAWKWIAFEPAAMSTTTTRSWRIRLWHCHDGKWCYDGVYNDNPSGLFQAYAYVRGNIRSTEAPGQKLEKLLFYSNSNSYFPNGTIFEIYGK